MVGPLGCCDRSDNNRILSIPDHIGICSFQQLDNPKSHLFGAPIEPQPRGCLGFAHWPRRSRRDNHRLRAFACSFEFADSTAADLLQPFPNWPAGAARGEERVLGVPGTLLVCLYCKAILSVPEADIVQVGSRWRGFPNRRRCERRRSWA